MAQSRSSRRSSKSTSGGLGRIDKAIESQKKRAAQRDKKWIKWEDGDTYVIRVLDVDDDFKDGFVHRVPMENDGKKYYLDVMCLDQDEKGVPCPGCKDDLQRRYKFWTNVIVRDYEDEKGNEADTVCIWSSGITVAKLLLKKHARYGLQNRDIEVERTGSTKDDTEYSIEWADDEDTPLTKEDKKLAEKRFDLARYVRAPDYDDFYKHPKDRGDSDDGEIGEQATKRNPFSKKKTDDDEGDKPKTTTRRRRSSSSTSKPNVRRRSR